jgi:hypothetical protein
MRAIGVRVFGPPSKLEFLDVPEPVITGPEDIIVAVHAVGLNPGDPIRVAGWSCVLETVKFVYTLHSLFQFYVLLNFLSLTFHYIPCLDHGLDQLDISKCKSQP